MPKFAGSQARAIGAEMRRARDSLEWTLETLAAATDISRSTLSRIETGARRADVGEAASILTALAITGPAKQRLLRLAGEGAGTWVEIGPAMEQQLSAIAAYESEARSISDFQISVVPGLLQTSAYARDLIGTSPLGTASRDRAARTRIARQSALNRPALSDYRAFIDEAALRRRVGADPRTMTDQLRKLVETVQRPGLEVRVVPFSSGAYWGCEGPFTLYDLGSHHVVYQENAGSGVFIEEQAIELYQRVLVNLDRLALAASESNDLLTRYAKRYEHDL